MRRRQPTDADERAARKRRGAFPTPAELVGLVVDRTVPAVLPAGDLSVLDPACGDGRFLVAAGRRVRAAGGIALLHGVDVDPAEAAAARAALAAAGFADTSSIDVGDALGLDWAGRAYDVVVGNPPFLSQLASASSRGRASARGGGPYADVAAEFLALAIERARPDGGRVGLVLPQSILASRDVAAVREAVDRQATMRWSWWSPGRPFDAHVHVCCLVFERREDAGARPPARWSRVVTDALGVPDVPALGTGGRLGDHVRLSADFRDQYYGLVGAVVDAAEAGDGPVACDRWRPLVTSGLVEPGRCAWGARPVTFARQRFARPLVALDRLGPRARRWAEAMAVPKVLVANQTTVVEAVADEAGRWLPGVPVLTARPTGPTPPGQVAAALTSPVATVWCWHRAAGSGISARAVRLGPRWLAELPWPAGAVEPAADRLAAGDVVGCGRAVLEAYGLNPDGDGRDLLDWWSARLPAR